MNIGWGSEVRRVPVLGTAWYARWDERRMRRGDRIDRTAV